LELLLILLAALAALGLLVAVMLRMRQHRRALAAPEYVGPLAGLGLDLSAFPEGGSRAVILAYVRATQLLARAGVEPFEHETATEFAMRARPQAAEAALRELTALYLAARFSGQALPAEEGQRAWALVDKLQTGLAARLFRRAAEPRQRRWPWGGPAA
jgi:hypothetical protein